MIAHKKTCSCRRFACTLVLLLGFAAGTLSAGHLYAQVDEGEPPEAPQPAERTTLPASPAPVDAPAAPEDAGASEQPASAEEAAAAEEAASLPEPEASTVSDPWQAFFPPPDPQFDWIQLTSGEWLKGELKGLYNYQLEFESDELDTLTFDWEDIKIVRTARPREIGYDEPDEGGARWLAFGNRRPPTVVFGRLTLIEHDATIGTSPTATKIKRDQIVTIASGNEKEGDLWSGEFTLGANFRRGNSDLSDANIYFKAQRRRAITRFYMDYRASFSRAGEEELSNNHRIKASFDSFRSSRLYWRVVYVDYYRDRFQNIENQLTAGSGLGYDIIRTARTEWSALVGLGALYKESTSVQSTEDAANTSPALALATNYDIELTSRVDYFLGYTAQIVDEENGSYVHELVTTLSSDITGNLDLDLTLVWNHAAKPRRAEDGTLPDQDDYRLGVSISYEF